MRTPRPTPPRRELQILVGDRYVATVSRAGRVVMVCPPAPPGLEGGITDMGEDTKEKAPAR